ICDLIVCHSDCCLVNEVFGGEVGASLLCSFAYLVPLCAGGRYFEWAVEVTLQSEPAGFAVIASTLIYREGPCGRCGGGIDRVTVDADDRVTWEGECACLLACNFGTEDFCSASPPDLG